MKTILVIDDDEDSHFIFSAFLEDTYKVMTFLNWKEVEEFAKQEIPNLILLDISMPHEDGFAVLKHIRANSHLKNIPVIALTAYALDEDNKKFLKHSFDGFISKPIYENQLRKLITHTFENKK